MTDPAGMRITGSIAFARALRDTGAEVHPYCGSPSYHLVPAWAYDYVFGTPEARTIGRKGNLTRLVRAIRVIGAPALIGAYELGGDAALRALVGALDDG